MQSFMSHNEEDKQFVEKIGHFEISKEWKYGLIKWKMTPVIL